MWIRLSEFLISESGGKFLGWLGIIIYSLALFVITLPVLFGKAIITDFYDILTTDSNNIYPNDKFYNSNINDYHWRKHHNVEKHNSRYNVIKVLTEARVEILIPLFSVLYAILILRLLASISLLNGTKRVSFFISLFQRKYVIY